MLKSLLSISLSLLLAATPLYAAPADNQTAGEVKALIPAASRNAQPVNVRDSLEWNDLLKTGAQGRLRAELTAGSILSLGSNSELQVVQHDAVSQQTFLVVNYGKLRNQVGKITKPDGKYEVRTPNAVIGVIGTDFYVGYANRQTTVICYVGKVAVTPAPGAEVLNRKSEDATATVLLLAGQMVVIGPDIPPGGYQATSTPAEVAEASMDDTNVPDVPDQPVRVRKGRTHGHQNVWIGLEMVAGLGLGLGLGIAKRGGSSGNCTCSSSGSASGSSSSCTSPK
jgi:ferric-dicitrate binding protein FerR (iron transport regulator)